MEEAYPNRFFYPESSADFYSLEEEIPIMRTFVVTAVLVIFSAPLAHSQSGVSQPAVKSVSAPQAVQDQSLNAMEAAGVKMSFDAASLKVNDTGRGEHSNVPLGPGAAFARTGGLFSAANEPFTQIFAWAFDLPGDQQLGAFSQLPKWALVERIDIEARAPGNPSKAQMELMMQSLLEERYKLAIHTDPKQGRVYALELVKAGKLGPQLTPHPEDPSCSATQPSPACASGLVPMPGTIPGAVRWDGRNVPVSIIAKYLPLTNGYSGIDRPVIDRTGLTGNYDFSIQFSPRSPTAPLQGSAADNAPTVIEALRDQLGLKLESTTGTVNAIVIDHIEEPTPN